MSEINDPRLPKFPRPIWWYSKHKARSRKHAGRWFVMRNDRTNFGQDIVRTVVVKDLNTRDEAIAMVKLLEITNGNS
jgi:hypothetical protein